MWRAGAGGPIGPALAAALVFACIVTGSRPAEAAFPGTNGKILFGSNRDGNREVYAMNPDGSGQVNLSNNPANEMDAAWSADGRQIAFVSTRDGNNEIYKMNADGSAQTRLTFDPADDRRPAWTNEGRVVFQRGPGGLDCAPGWDVYIMNADGSGVTRLTNDPAADCNPNVSATGRIVFSSWRDGNGELYSMNPDGSGPARITNSPTCELNPDWAPTAARLAFLRDLTPDCNGDNDLYIMNADGTGETRLTNTPDRIEFFPASSPQGDRIAFEGCPAATYPNCASQIYVINATGGGEVQLTSSGSNGHPDWQPKISQTITFGALPNKTYGDPDFTVSATASSGLPVTFAADGVCTVSGASVHITGVGVCKITASQPGDSSYNAAADVSQSFAIARPPCKVPKVVGKPVAAAKAALKQRHCRTGKVSYAYSKRTKKGRVSSQSRRPGLVLAANTKVNLVVSRGRKR
jgi:Tol biopolymer transport system component